MMLSYFELTTGEDVDFRISARQFLGAGETVVTAQAVTEIEDPPCTPPGQTPVPIAPLNVVALTYDETGCTVRLGGGQGDQQRYKVSIRIITSTGQRKVLAFGVLSLDDPFATDPVPVLTVTGGLVFAGGGGGGSTPTPTLGFTNLPTTTPSMTVGTAAALPTIFSVVDSAAETLTLVMTASNGTFTAPATGSGITNTGTVLTLTGSQVAINANIAAILFSPTAAGAASLALALTSTTVTTPIGAAYPIAAVAAGTVPVISVSDITVVADLLGELSYLTLPTTAQQMSVGTSALLPKQFTITDTVAETITLIATATGGTIDTPVTNLSAGVSNTGTVLTLTGDEATINADLAALMFTPAAAGSCSIALSMTSETVTAPKTADYLITGVDGSVVTLTRLATSGNQFVDADGNRVRLKSLNFSGAEGTNFAPHALWERPWKGELDQIKAWGFNSIRFPFSGDFCQDPAIPGTAISDTYNPDVVGKTALEFLDMIVDYCGQIGLYIVLDHHRTTAGAGQDGWPAAGGATGSYSVDQWHADWLVLANRYGSSPVVVGADVHNEPYAVAWADWAPMVEACAAAIHAVAPDWLIFVEGNRTFSGDITYPAAATLTSDSYWDGGQLAGAQARPISLSIENRLVYAPHEYGQSVASQSWLANGSTTPSGWPDNLLALWEEHWGWPFRQGLAPVWVGEFGGKFGYANADGTANSDAYASAEIQWLQTLEAYLNGDFNNDGTSDLGTNELGISFSYWNYMLSGDTGSLTEDNDLTTAQAGKITLLQPLLTAADTLAPSAAPTTDSILNIGNATGQNHFDVQVAPTGASDYVLHTMAEIAGGYDENPYFTVNADGTAVQFLTYMNAPTTSGSSYPRCELREVNADGTNMAFDALTGTHVLHGKSKITHLTANVPAVVVAQLHNGDTDRISIRTQLISGNIDLLCRINGSSSGLPRFQDSYVVGTEFEWKIEVSDGVASIYYNDMTTPLFTSTALVSTGGPTWYFKAGCYAQSNTSTDAGTDWSSVELRDLTCSHSS